MHKDLIQKLRTLYNDPSKHSNYQNVPTFISEALGYKETINEEWRGDTARYRYILEEIDFFEGIKVGDIGANTGFFGLSLGQRFSHSQIRAYEGNPVHAEYIRLIAQSFDLKNVKVEQRMVTLDTLQDLPDLDLLLFMNVLHHVGFDFEPNLDKKVDNFERYAIAYLFALTSIARRMVFQMGYDWGGDKNVPIIARENDYGKIAFSSRLLINAGWIIDRISLATKDHSGVIYYENLPDPLIELIRAGKEDQGKEEITEICKAFELSKFVGSFYRRPFFIVHSQA